jgi:Na+/phosphate symporter
MGAFSQSGTATAISALGFVAGGVMAVREGIAYSFGAQIGATLAIQLAAFRIAAYALPMIGVGFFLATLAARAHRPASCSWARGCCSSACR